MWLCVDWGHHCLKSSAVGSQGACGSSCRHGQQTALNAYQGLCRPSNDSAQFSTHPRAAAKRHCSPPHAVKARERLKHATLVTEAIRALAAWDCHCFSVHTGTGTEVVQRCVLAGWAAGVTRRPCCCCWAQIRPHAAHRHVRGAGAFLDAVSLDLECQQVRGTHLRVGRLSWQVADHASGAYCGAPPWLLAVQANRNMYANLQHHSRSSEATGPHER